MTNSLPRRRLLAAAVPGLLAGCLVESETGAGESGDDSVEGEGSEGDGSSSSGDGSDGADESSDADESSTEQVADAEDAPDEIGTDGSGLVVTNVDVLDVTAGGYQTTVQVRITVENAGRFTYGTVELRADAYATRLRDDKPVGFEYVRREFGSNERFVDGTAQFTVEITVRNSETHTRPDPDWYEVDAAVRRAEPV